MVLRSQRRRRKAGLTVVAGAAALIGLALPAPASSTLSTAPIRSSQTSVSRSDRVIVQATDVAAARRAVASAGGRVDRPLPIVHGVAATVPSTDLQMLAERPGVRAVTSDSSVRFASVPSGRATTSAVNPPSVYRSEVQAGQAHGQGANGQGVTVAVLDTGIDASPDLAGRIMSVTNPVTGVQPCENLSGEASCRDNYGHGTFMAGIIAGNGSVSGGTYAGIAPQAHLVSIKVGSADGSADISNILAGIQWAVSFRAQYNIKVLNLSLGTDSTQSWKVDPLNYAVERAWAAGITVVVAASNRGPNPSTISKPADDPWVITVGAVDDLGTTTVSDDLSPDFSGRGPSAQGLAKPDLAAPGAHIVSLRAPGSSIDNQFPQRIDSAYHQGSGTSMSTAVVSGVAALVLSTHPAMTPNRLKYSLTSTTQPAASTDPAAVGSGVVNAFHALTAPPGVANGGLTRSSGLGSLGSSRGTVLVQTNDPLHTVIRGPLTVQLLLWDPVGYTIGDWTASTWYDSVWFTQPIFSTVWYADLWDQMDTTGCSSDSGEDSGCTYGGGHNWEGNEWYGSWD